MDAPHLGHLSADNLKPGLGGTSALQAGHMPTAGPPLAGPPAEEFILLPFCPKFLIARVGFCPFLCGIGHVLR